MTILSFCIVSFFVLWFAASVALYVPGPWQGPIRKLAAWSVMPAVTYFAPDPVDVDFHLVFRDVLLDGTTGSWQEVPFENPRPLSLLWDLSKRQQRALLDATSELSRLASEVAPACRSGERMLLLSFPYLFLLNLVAHQPRARGATHRQFVIVQSQGFGNERRLSLGIASELHALDRP
jgi:hypothetical protein